MSANRKRGLDKGGDGSYHPNPTLQVGSVHFNAMYDGQVIEANEEAWRTQHSKMSPDAVLTFSRTAGGGAHSDSMVSNREVYDLLQNEPVIVCAGSSLKSRQLKHGCFVVSSLNHMCITDHDVCNWAKSSSSSPGSALHATVKQWEQAGADQNIAEYLVSRLNDTQKREVLQRKYKTRFVGFSVGPVKNQGYLDGQKPHVACNAGGLMSVKVDEPIETGQYVVVDYPLKNLKKSTDSRTNTCCVPQSISRATSKDGDAHHYLEEKVTMIVRSLDPATDFSSMSRPCFHAATGYCGSKYPPWVVGQCVRGCSQAGQTIELRYRPELRYPSYMTLLSPPPTYMNRPSRLMTGGSGSGGSHGANGYTPGTTFHDIYAASVFKMTQQSRDGDGSGSMKSYMFDELPSIDCQDLLRHLLDRWRYVSDMDEGDLEKEGQYTIDPVTKLMGLIDSVTDLANNKAIMNVDELKDKLKDAIKYALKGEAMCELS